MADNKINPLKAFLPLVGIFILVNLLGSNLNLEFSTWKIDAKVLFWGNLILFLASAVSYYFYQKSISNTQPYGFLNNIYAGILVKMMLCLVAAFIYIKMAGKSVNKPAIFACMLLYLVYTTVELLILVKLSKQQKNA
jgi:hypothetical protein